MIIDEKEIGLGYGLNKGLKVGKFLKKNVRLKNVNLRNAIAVGSIAASFVPAGGVATKLATKLTKLGKVGKLAKGAVKLANTKVGKFVMNKAKQGRALYAREANVVTQIAVAQDVDTTTPNVMTPDQFSEVTAGTGAVQADAPVKTNVQSVPNEAQLETLSNIKEIPVDNLKEEAVNQITETTPPTETTKKDNTMLYVGIGAVAVIGIGLAMSNNSNPAPVAK
jgi:hypothetical protein